MKRNSKNYLDISNAETCLKDDQLYYATLMKPPQV